MNVPHPIARNMVEWMRTRYGSNWFVARRWNQYLRRRYPDGVLISPKRYAAEAAACAAVHGAYDTPSSDDPTYVIAPARYAKGQLAVRTVGDGSGFKTRAARLIGDGLNARYSERERAYIASPATVAEFKRLFAAGWDASVMTGELEPPKGATP